MKKKQILYIIIGVVVAYIIYKYLSNKGLLKTGGEWKPINWGGSQNNGTEVLLHCSTCSNIQSDLKVGDMIEFKVDSCQATLDYINSNRYKENIYTGGCKSKICECRNDLNGTHEVVGFGDSDNSAYANSGFRIKAVWNGMSSPTPSIVDGMWRKV